MKECSNCKSIKEETEFYKKGNRIQSYCKPCFNKYCSERWIERKQEAIKYLGGSCKNCGYSKYYGALEFHHRDPTSKEFDWGTARKLNKKAMFNELGKCDLLCSNCHKEIHKK